MVLSQIRVVFVGLPSTPELSLAQSLRALPDTPIGLRTAAADVYPVRTRETYFRELQGQLRALLDELGSFLAAGVLTDELEAVDRLLRGHPFMILVRDVLVGDIWLKGSRVPAEQRAELLDQLESVLPARPYDGPVTTNEAEQYPVRRVPYSSSPVPVADPPTGTVPLPQRPTHRA